MNSKPIKIPGPDHPMKEAADPPVQYIRSEARWA